MQVFAEFENQDEMLAEFQANLSKGRAFVPGTWDVKQLDACELVLVHPTRGEWMPLSAEVVYVGPPEQPCVGLELRNFDQALSALIESFIEEQVEPLVLDSTGSEAAPGPSRASLSDGPSSRSPISSRRAPRSQRQMLSKYPSEPPPKNVQERVRKLNVRERDAMARQGTLSERVALERAYGAAVWDALLSNVSLTGPEVARIAKNGNVTQPHLKLIVANASWLTKAEVRRALLTSPRLTEPQIEKVLRALPPAELRQLPQQTAYAPKVRAVARRLLPKGASG